MPGGKQLELHSVPAPSIVPPLREASWSFGEYEVKHHVATGLEAIAQNTLDPTFGIIDIVKVARHRQIDIERCPSTEPVDDIQRVATLQNKLLHHHVIRKHGDDDGLPDLSIVQARTG